MKYILSCSLIKGLLMGLLLITVACGHNHNHEEGHDNATHDDHSEHDHDAHIPQKDDDHDDHDDHGNGNKMVHLNEAQFKNAEIDTGWFVMKNLSDIIHANGYTELDPQNQAEVSMPIDGTIKSIKVIEGSYVKKGQTLATMLSLAYNEKLLERAKLQEELAISEANRTYLEKEFSRQNALAMANINAKKVLEKVSADLQIEKAKINAVLNQIGLLNETIYLFDTDDETNYLKIVAPISGHITKVNLKIGATVAAGFTMFSMVNNSKMHVDLMVYEKDLSKIKVGQTVRFILTNQSNKEIKGTIYNIGKAFANETKSVAVHADIAKNNAKLIPGMYINALIDIGTNKVQAVPETAIVMAEGRTFIFLWEKENALLSHTDDEHSEHDHDDAHKEISFMRLEVKTGAKQLGYVGVIPLDKIHDGDKIVLNGAYYLQSHLQKEEGGGGHHH